MNDIDFNLKLEMLSQKQILIDDKLDIVVSLLGDIMYNVSLLTKWVYGTDDVKPPVEFKVNSPSYVTPPNTPLDDHSKSLYYSIPEDGGIFPISKGKVNMDEMIFYRIDYIENSNEGNLFYVSTKFDSRAIDKFETYITPVCEIENQAPFLNCQSIILISPGKVNLSNGSWVVDPFHKAVIRVQ